MVCAHFVCLEIIHRIDSLMGVLIWVGRILVCLLQQQQGIKFTNNLPTHVKLPTNYGFDELFRS